MSINRAINYRRKEAWRIHTMVDVETQAGIPAIPPVMLAAAFANTERLVGLCLRAEGNQFQRLPLHTRHGIYTGKFLYDLVTNFGSASEWACILVKYNLMSRPVIHVSSRSTRWRSCLRHYATNRKVAGSIPDEVIWFFNWPNPSSHTMALGSTQPLTEMSMRNLPGDKRRPARKLTSPPSVSRLSRKCGRLHGLFQELPLLISSRLLKSSAQI
jgi:hypothetical protein